MFFCFSFVVLTFHFDVTCNTKLLVSVAFKCTLNPRMSHHILGVLPDGKDVSVLLRTAAHRNCCLSSAL